MIVLYNKLYFNNWIKLLIYCTISQIYKYFEVNSKKNMRKDTATGFSTVQISHPKKKRPLRNYKTPHIFAGDSNAILELLQGTTEKSFLYEQRIQNINFR